MTDEPAARRGLSGKAAARALEGSQALCVLGPVAIIVVWAFTASWPWPSLLPETLSARGVEELFGPAQRLTDVLGTSMGIALATAVLTTTVARSPGAPCRATGSPAARSSASRCSRPSSSGHRLRHGRPGGLHPAGLAGTVAGVVVSHVIVALPYASLIMVDAMEAAGSASRNRRACAGPAARGRGRR